MTFQRFAVPIALTTCLLLWLASCEEEFTPPVVNAENQLVVEGYIEAGDRPTPPYVLLTRSFPFFSKLSAEQLDESFVHDAEITVSDGSQTVVLTELCLQEIPPEFRDQVGQFLGLNPDSIGFNFCAYLDLSFTMLGEEGKTYLLEVKTANETLRATTTIPYAVPLDSLFFQPPPGEPNDTLAQLVVDLQNPPGVPNYYRYFTQENDGPFLRPFGSITDDLLFDGQLFEFPLAKAAAPVEDFDFETFGLYRLGTRATIKWMTIDADQFNFWNTLEFSRSNQGPFSSYTRVDHNIEGGLGIWGGIAARYYEREVRY